MNASLSPAVSNSADAAPQGVDANDLKAALTRVSLRVGDATKDTFLMECASALQEELRADYFIIARLNPFSNMMRTLCFLSKTGPLGDFIHNLDGTPCEDALRNGVCLHSDGIAQRYPRDRYLAEFGVSSYAGASLNTTRGEKIGVMVAMWKTPIHDRDFVLGLISHFRARLGGFIDMTERTTRYAWAIANVFGGVWEWDLRTGGTTLSDGLENLLCGGSKGRGPCDLAQIEETIHPEDRRKHEEALKRHLADATPYDLRLRLRSPDGTYRWYVSRGEAMRDADGKPTRMIGGFCDIHDAVTVMEKTGRA